MFRFPYIKILFLLLALPFVCSSQPSGVKITKQKYDSEKTRILFIVDCSYSMNERWQSNTKIKIAQSLISNIVDTLALYSDVETALRVFGNEKNYSDGNCDDTQLLTPFYRLNADNMKAKLKTLIPKGTSAVAKSLQKAADDFPSDKNCRNIVIMIVDNIDKCDGDVSAVSQMMQKQGKYIRPFIIGTSRGMKNIYENCGNYYEVKGEVEFSKVLNNTIKQALHSTTLQVNLLDVNMEATETNVPITFYDSESHNLRYSFIHSFSANGASDTVSVDPLVKYDIVVHTIPPVKKENTTLNAGTHNVIPVLAPQGAMVVRYTSASKTYSPVMYPVIVRKSGGRETINVQQLNAKEKYLVGKYDLEVLSEPRLVIENVEVGQSSTTTIEIPEPGVLRLEKQGGEMTVSLFSKTSQQTQWVKNINDEASKLMMNLMPGEYMIVSKGKNSSQMQKTIVQEVKIESNKTTNVVLSLKK